MAGVALFFVPRLRGRPLAWPVLLPLVLGLQLTSLILRFVSQPLLVATGWLLWKIFLILSGVLEALALSAIVLLLMQSARGKSATKSSVEGVRSIAPFLFGAFLGLALAGIINLLNFMIALTNGGLIPPEGDQANITLGLFGFLVPVAHAMSTCMLPLYTGIQPFPAPLLWLLALAYFAGVILDRLVPSFQVCCWQL